MSPVLHYRFPTGHDGKRPNPKHDPEEAAFFSNLYDALSREHLLSGLFSMISLKSDCFPDSMVQCLQLFHITLNWLQFHFTEKDQRLKLPSSWRNLIKELTTFPDPVIADAAFQWLNMFDCLEKEQDHCNSWLGIAKQLKPQKVVPMPKIAEEISAQQQYMFQKNKHISGWLILEVFAFVGTFSWGKSHFRYDLAQNLWSCFL